MSTQTIKQTLSIARLSTYEKAISKHVNFEDALDLYGWNAEISAALLMPLHICEITLRNAISQALRSTHGNRWPWAEGFERSLSSKGYNPRQDLQSSRKRQKHTDKVIPELNFVFWQKLITARFDQDLWEKQFYQVFPNILETDLKTERQKLHEQIEQIRRLRNRIAHHEPIFNRNLQNDFDVITWLIRVRCDATAKWMLSHQQVSTLLQKLNRPTI